MEFLANYGLFLVKVLTLVISFIVIAVVIVGLASKGEDNDDNIKVKKLNKRFDKLKQSLQKTILNKSEQKQLAKQQKQAEKQAKKNHEHKPRVFLLEFNGDIKASAVAQLRDEVTAIIAASQAGDEVAIKLESPGGQVHAYGLASSQLVRLKQHGLKLTALVDKVAASGGYMMACVADKVIAAPFALIGSIGVIGQLPNLNRLLDHNHIDWEQHTAGEFKRTLTVFGENTDAGREKFKQELEDVHHLFKGFISEHRPQVDLSKVATGEYWFGIKAFEYNLVDKLQTSDDYLLSASETSDIYSVKIEPKKSLKQKLGLGVASTIQNLLVSAWQTIKESRFIA